MLIHQISVFVENRVGRLSEVVGLISKNGIDIRALSIADTSDFGILRMIVNDPDKAFKVLCGEGITAKQTDVIAVSLNDEPGALAEILQNLTESGITVEYAYAFITRKDDDACVILRVEDNAKAIEVLMGKGRTLIEAKDVYGI